MTIQDRLSLYLNSKKLTFRDFERLCNLSNGTAARLRETTRKTTFDRIANSCDLNTDWLLTGEGEMLTESPSNAHEVGRVIDAGDYEDIVSQVEFIPVSAHATFLENLYMPSDSEFDTMSVILTPAERAQIEQYKIFEIDGDSMSPAIRDGALVLAKEVPESRWHYAEGTVIIIYDEYVVIKRITANKILTDNFIELSSDNEAYGKMIVQLSDIRAIYKAKRIISSVIV